MWETIPDNAGSDDGTLAGSSCVVNASAQETAKLFVPSSPTGQQGYHSMAPLSGKDLFGPFSQQSREENSMTSNPTSKPFLALPSSEMMVDSNGLRANEEKGNSSDSDAAPQEFHAEESPYRVSVEF